MKNLLAVLMVWVLLGFMPLEAWRQGTPEQQEAFIKGLAMDFGQAEKCSSVEITVYSQDGMVIFEAECLKKAGEVKL